MKPASVYHAALAEAPPGTMAWCATAADGVRLRIATSPAGEKGTILLFPGRNEHIEKYGRTATTLGDYGFSSVVIDWRGQGHSERVAGTGYTGHVESFTDYQHDVAAMLDIARGAELPEPFYLIAHSMGGAIGLRAVVEGLPVKAAVFSAPMWGIKSSAILRMLAPHLVRAGRLAGLSRAGFPTGPRESYLLATSFEDNRLTHDPGMYDYMLAQARRDPKLALGRPTFTWLSATLEELRAQEAFPAPAVPVYVAIVAEEDVVDNSAILRLAARWPGVAVEEYDNARHEIMVELPHIRTRFFETVIAHFEAA